MKTLLKLLTAITLTIVTTSSASGCQVNNPLTMNIQVQKDFNFLDANNNPTINLEIYQNNINKITKWNSIQLTNITANNLLTNNDDETTKAKSTEAADFLINILKLKPTNVQEKNKTFKHSDAQNIIMKVKTYSPLITKNSNHNDYVINGGTVMIYFAENGKRVSSDYSLNILANPNNGIVANKLPIAAAVTLADFNDIPEFKIGQAKSKILVNDDLTNYLKTTIYSWGERIADLMKQGDHFKVKVSENEVNNKSFVKGDIIKIRFSIGEIQFRTEYTLTLI